MVRATKATILSHLDKDAGDPLGTINHPTSRIMTKEPPHPPPPTGGPSYLWVGLKLVVALALLVSGGWQFRGETAAEEELQLPQQGETTHRRLSEASSYPYVAPFLAELQARKKLFAEAEVIKYWFEYSGPLQVSAFPWWKLTHGAAGWMVAERDHTGCNPKWDRTRPSIQSIVHLKFKVTLCLRRNYNIKQKSDPMVGVCTILCMYFILLTLCLRCLLFGLFLSFSPFAEILLSLLAITPQGRLL